MVRPELRVRAQQYLQLRQRQLLGQSASGSPDMQRRDYGVTNAALAETRATVVIRRALGELNTGDAGSAMDQIRRDIREVTRELKTLGESDLERKRGLLTTRQIAYDALHDLDWQAAEALQKRGFQ
ncbi:MAG TPA: hypothetical protein VEW42_05415 [Candidatus Eisenbacteria bacterium]|nr:hypothetical protein [Candidatus Eisenbacteria bacterium]